MQQELYYYIITDANEIVIDEKFKRILPVLSEDELASLERSILKYGCIEPLILWNNVLLDGHNRLEILKRHELPIKTVSLELSSREDALVWIIEFQITRRNLTPIQLSYYRGLHYHTEKQIITNAAGKNQFTEVEVQSEPQPLEQSTAVRLADHYNVSRSTIKRDAHVANAINAIGEASPEIKTDILSGRTHMTRKQLKELSSGTQEDVSAVLDEIKDGTFVSRRPPASSASPGSEGGELAIDSGNMQPWEKEFSKMTDDFKTTLRGYANTEDATSVKTALRQYISMLEELYNNI